MGRSGSNIIHGILGDHEPGSRINWALNSEDQMRSPEPNLITNAKILNMLEQSQVTAGSPQIVKLSRPFAAFECNSIMTSKLEF